MGSRERLRHIADDNNYNLSEAAACWSNNAIMGGKELPDRPRKKDIWTNRKINIKNFDRLHYEGW